MGFRRSTTGRLLGILCSLASVSLLLLPVGVDGHAGKVFLRAPYSGATVQIGTGHSKRGCAVERLSPAPWWNGSAGTGGVGLLAHGWTCLRNGVTHLLDGANANSSIVLTYPVNFSTGVNGIVVRWTASVMADEHLNISNYGCPPWLHLGCGATASFMMSDLGSLGDRTNGSGYRPGFPSSSCVGVSGWMLVTNQYGGTKIVGTNMSMHRTIRCAWNFSGPFVPSHKYLLYLEFYGAVDAGTGGYQGTARAFLNVSSYRLVSVSTY